LRKTHGAGNAAALPPRAAAGMTVGADVAKPQPTAIVTAVVGTKMHRGLNDTRASVGRRHRSRSHGRPGRGLGCLVLTQDIVGLVGETCKRLGLLGALTSRHEELGWRSLCRSTSAGPSSVQHDKQPQEAQDGELVINMVRNHGNAPSQWCDTKAL